MPVRLYTYLYGLSGDDFADVPDTFTIVRRKDEAAHGEYRTRCIALAVFDARVESELDIQGADIRAR